MEKKLSQSVRSLDGVGEVRGKLLENKQISTIEDLLYYFPRAYEDRTQEKEIALCEDGETVCIKATVFSPVKEARIRKNMAIYSMEVTDDSGVMKIVWYNNRFMKGRFKSGEVYVFYGVVKRVGRTREMLNPIFETPGKQRQTGRIMPIYPLWANLTQNFLQGLTRKALDAYRITDWIPHSVRKAYHLAEIGYAMEQMHYPHDADAQLIARERFAFEELFLLQLALLEKRGQVKKYQKSAYRDTACVSEWIGMLPFALTGAQRRVIAEIMEDFEKGVPMNRLVQGDVGSGKTAVAAAAMYVAAKNGEQSVIMAPTEILANQHYETFLEFFKDTSFRICLLTGSTKGKKQLYEQIRSGAYDLVVGTHAVIQKAVEFSKLGLVIADEQHRFGVKQRAMLSEKGEHPHFLVMSATPIPRTLALILYGDLDVSIIDELPPGRKPVATYAVGENMRQRLYAFIEKNVKSGTQAYVVCPLIEETEKSDLSNAQTRRDELASRFPDFRVGLVHGRMKAKEKDEIMTAFAKGEMDILVSTTVIEVGVNVPNSNLMIIENAERFGLSQLHQLRGRVGRGTEQAYCILIKHGTQEITEKRMKTMCASNDGFYISEQDLKLRGPGDFFGTRQHGLPELRVANLFEDMEILKRAQNAAGAWYRGELPKKEAEQERVEEKIETMFQKALIDN
ncbi:MAG: ATP-dependent DNA helicase RecG [Ruminococcaceae bacterium]|nr:ATP-dependent DNA helicase RecG [Oscillospiraceae bacterium]